MRLGALSLAAHGSEAVWERAFLTGERGRRQSVGVCLFNAKRNEEARVEFGAYSPTKLPDDPKKLAVELPATTDHRVLNFVMLWRTRGVRRGCDELKVERYVRQRCTGRFHRSLRRADAGGLGTRHVCRCKCPTAQGASRAVLDYEQRSSQRTGSTRGGVRGSSSLRARCTAGRAESRAQKAFRRH